MRLADLIAITGGGADERGQMVLNVLARDGESALLRLTDQAASELCCVVPLAMLGKKVRGAA